MIYLASPYSHPDEIVREHRFRAVCVVAAKLMQNGNPVFSPIAHSHSIAMAGKLPLGFEFWEKCDRQMLRACDGLVVLKLPGWDESMGVSSEIKMAIAMGITVSYLEFVID